MKFFLFPYLALMAILLLPGGVEAFSPDDAGDTDTSEPGTNSCFSADSTVRVRGRGAVAMRDLKVGDYVLSWESNHYQRVYAFLHRNEVAEAEYLRVETDLSPVKPLEMTKDHLLYVQDKSFPVPAESIVVGDVLRGEGGKPARVTRVTSTSRSDGVYAPLTPDGTLLVNGIQVSSYVVLEDMEDHYFLGFDQSFVLHMVLSPFRFFCQWVSESYAHSFDKEGLPPFVSFLNNFRAWLVQQSIPTQALSFFCCAVFAAAFWILECVLGNVTALSFVASVAGVVFVLSHKTNNGKVKSV